MSEIKRLDTKTRKLLTLSKMHHTKADVDRLYLSRNAGGRGLIQLKASYKTTTIGLDTYLKNTDDALIELVQKHDHHPHHHHHHHHHHGGLSRASRLRFQSLRSFMHAGSSAEVVAPISSCRMLRKVVSGLPDFRLAWVGSHNTSWLAGSSLCL